ncbi:hypothetical protein ACKVV1_011469, partial [Pyricularia oryzae]
EAVNQHMDALGHWAESEYECDDCSDAFSEEENLRDHEISEHFYCDLHDRYFQDENSIRNHLNGSSHRKADLTCPFCKTMRTNATGLIHHLERGACPSAPIDRSKLYDEIRRRDPNNILTNKLLMWQDTDTYEATEKAWNANANGFECYFCHRSFKKLESLNQHLKSPKHREDIYHCPNRDCSKESPTLAAIINHLESESCRFLGFEAVQQTAQRIVTPGRMIAF